MAGEANSVLIDAGIVIPMDGGRTVYDPGSVLVTEGVIVAVGPVDEVARHPAADVPELAEEGRAGISRIAAPRKLARQLVIEPDHVSLDEPGVPLEERDGVSWDVLAAWQ